MKKEDLVETLSLLEDMVYQYVEEPGESGRAGDELKEIYDYCRSNPPIQLTEGSCRCSSKCSSKKPTGKPPAPNPKKKIVKPVSELLEFFDFNGYEFKKSMDCWGWSNQEEELPNFFNLDMIMYCGKEPGGHWNWRQEWLK